MNNFEDVVGKRVLVRVGFGRYTGEVNEVVVVEVSPSGKYVKLRFPSGYEAWKEVNRCVLVEVLGDENEV